MNSMKVIQRLLWGVDFRILNQCVDEKVRFIKYELFILILSALSVYAFMSVANNVRIGNNDVLATIIGLAVFVTYKLYLSNLHTTLTNKNNAFIQWLVATLFALGVAYCCVVGVFNVSIDQNMSITDIITTGIVAIVSLVMFYTPVRFNEAMDSQYAKLLKMTLEEEKKWAELAVNNTLQQETQRHHVQSDLNNKAEQLSIDMIAREIANARTRVAKEALAKWEEQQKKLIQSNVENYIRQQ